MVGPLYGSVNGANNIITTGSISGTTLYGTLTGSNTVTASTLFGTLSGANTISGSTITGTTLVGPLYGSVNGANTISGTTITGTTLVGPLYGSVNGSNTISGTTISGTTLVGPLYGSVNGANTISGTTITGTTLVGPLYGSVNGANNIITTGSISGTTLFGTLSGANTISGTTISGTTLVGPLYGSVNGANTISGTTISGTTLVGPLYGAVSGSNTVTASTMYGTLAGANTISGTTITGTTLVGPLYGSVNGSNTISASSISISNTTPSASSLLSLGQSTYVTDTGQYLIVTRGNVSASNYFGSGLYLSNITGATTAATYGTASTVPQIVVDSSGRITSITSVGITPSSGSTLAAVVNTGNTTANVVQFTSTSNTMVVSGNILLRTTMVQFGIGAGTSGQTANAIAIGNYAGQFGQNTQSVAIGDLAGQSGQRSQAVAIGYKAGQSNQSSWAISIGNDSGTFSQDKSAVAIGDTAGQTSQGIRAIAIGLYSGFISQNAHSIGIGYLAGASGQQSHAVALGMDSGEKNQSANSIAIGSFAGYVGQNTQSIAIGDMAGQSGQYTDAVAIGENAGQFNQQDRCVAIGQVAGQSTQGAVAVAIGSGCGQFTQGNRSVAIGQSAGNSIQGSYALAIGYFAGQYSQNNFSVALGHRAGTSYQYSNAIAIGNYAGHFGQNTYATSIGDLAGQSGQRSWGIAIGYGAGQFNQGQSAVAIGIVAGQSNQGTSALAIGDNAGARSQNAYSVALGFACGMSGQYSLAVAIGSEAGRSAQGLGTVAIGWQAGMTEQKDLSVAIGWQAGLTSQSFSAVAIGHAAGMTTQGSESVAIGYLAGYTVPTQVRAVQIGTGNYGCATYSIGIGFGAQASTAGSIVLNATGPTVVTSSVAGFHVAPVRSNVSQIYACEYNTTTKEISYATHRVNWNGYTNNASITGANPFYALVAELESSGGSGGSVHVSGTFGYFYSYAKSYIDFFVTLRDGTAVYGNMYGAQDISYIAGAQDFVLLNRTSDGKRLLYFKVNTQYTTFDFYVSVNNVSGTEFIKPVTPLAAGLPSGTTTLISSIFTTTYIKTRNVNGALKLATNVALTWGDLGSTAGTDWCTNFVDSAAQRWVHFWGRANSTFNAAGLRYNYVSAGNSLNYIGLGQYNSEPLDWAPQSSAGTGTGLAIFGNGGCMISTSITGTTTSVQPTLLLQANSGASSVACLDFKNYNSAIPASGRIGTFDQGNYGSDMVFFAKTNGGNGSTALNEVFRATYNGYLKAAIMFSTSSFLIGDRSTPANTWNIFCDGGTLNFYWNPGSVYRFQFDTSGNAYKASGVGSWLAVSDERLKESIEFADLDICYENIKNLKLKRYRYKEGVVGDKDKTQLGWLAQDVKKIFQKSIYINKHADLEDCNWFSDSQIMRSLYGAVQKIIEKIETPSLKGKGTIPTGSESTVISVPGGGNSIIQVTPIFNVNTGVRTLNVSEFDSSTSSFTVYGAPGDFYWSISST